MAFWGWEAGIWKEYTTSEQLPTLEPSSLVEYRTHGTYGGCVQDWANSVLITVPHPSQVTLSSPKGK